MHVNVIGHIDTVLVAKEEEEMRNVEKLSSRMADISTVSVYRICSFLKVLNSSKEVRKLKGFILT